VLLSLTAFFVTAVLIGLNVPFAAGGETSFITLVVIGGIACADSETQSALRFKRVGWEIKRRIKHPLTIAGIVLGTLALLLIIFTFKGTGIGFITGYTTAFISLAVLCFILYGFNIQRNAVLT
jgi:hypothetical protein